VPDQNRRDALERLADSPLFAGVARSACQEAVDLGRERPIAPGDVLFREGEPAVTLYLVLEGRMKLSQLGVDGQEVVIRFVVPGGVVAALAVLDQGVYPVTATAVTATRALSWSHDVFATLMQRTPALAVNAMRLLSERLREMQQRFREVATERVAQRVARALVRLVRLVGRKTDGGVLIDMPLSRQDLAEMTGTTLYTVSRILSEWESAGLVTSGRERITIRAPHRLVALAEDLPKTPSPTSED
jgi:CRP-like cAMP-binding protein